MVRPHTAGNDASFWSAAIHRRFLSSRSDLCFSKKTHGGSGGSWAKREARGNKRRLKPQRKAVINHRTPRGGDRCRGLILGRTMYRQHRLAAGRLLAMTALLAKLAVLAASAALVLESFAPGDSQGRLRLDPFRVKEGRSATRESGDKSPHSMGHHPAATISQICRGEKLPAYSCPSFKRRPLPLLPPLVASTASRRPVAWTANA